MEEKVSIIIPVYNLEEFIIPCLNSIIQQSYQNIEVIVIDDGSSDHSWDRIIEFQRQDKRIIAIRQTNGGAGKARNTGLKRISGKYIMFVDGDDQLSLETIEENLTYFENDIDWVSFPIKRIKQDGTLIADNSVYNHFVPTKEEIIKRKDFVSSFCNKKLSELCCGTIYKVSSIKGIQFPESEYYEDSFFFTDILHNTQQGFLSTKGSYLYVERMGSSQVSVLDFARLESKRKCLTDRLKKLRELDHEYESYYQKLENDFYYFLRLQKAKKIKGVTRVLNTFTKEADNFHKIQFKKEVKIYFYHIVGYHTIKKISKWLK